MFSLQFTSFRSANDFNKCVEQLMCMMFGQKKKKLLIQTMNPPWKDLFESFT